MNYLEQNCLNQKVELTNVSELDFQISQDDENTKTVVFCNLITTSFDSDTGDILRINLKYASINQKGEFCRVSKTILHKHAAESADFCRLLHQIT